MRPSRILAGCLPLLLGLACTTGDTGDLPQGPHPGVHLELRDILRNVGAQPNILALSASGGAFMVGTLAGPYLTIIDADDNSLRRSLLIRETDRTLGIAASPQGIQLYIAAVDGSTVLVYNLDSGLPDRDPLIVGQSTNLVETSTNGRFVLATAFSAGLFVALDGDFDFQPADAPLVLDDRPAGLAVTRHSLPERAYVVGIDRGKIYEIEFDPSRVAVTDSVVTETGASFIDLSPVNESIAYVSSSERDRVLEVDLGAGIVTRLISVGSAPLGLEVSPDGRFVVVANSESNSASLIDTEQGITIDELTVGSGPTDVLFTSNTRVYVTLQGEDGIAVLDLVQ